MTQSLPIQDSLDWTHKGIDPSLHGQSAAGISAAKRSLFDDGLLFPVAILRDSALRANSAWMRAFLTLTGVKIAPHGKTTMAPDLFRLQLEDGAWAISAATVHHVQCYRKFGLRRVFLANQLVGAGAIGWILEEMRRHPDFDFYCLVDSTDNLAELARLARHAGCARPLQVLIEVGCPNGRSGVRNLQAGVHLAQAIAQAAPFIELVGVETFEGVTQLSSEGRAASEEMLRLVLDLARSCDERGLFAKRALLSAGGSAYFDLVARQFAAIRLSVPVEVVIRSGCYLTHDTGLYARLFEAIKERMPELVSIGYDLEPALQVWGHVLSRPEPGRIICGIGKRDVGSDIEMPKVIAWARVGDAAPRPVPSGVTVRALNDQHAFIDGPAEAPFRTGDFLGFGISHPCTTFDKWRALLRVNDHYQLEGFVKTYF